MKPIEIVSEEVSAAPKGLAHPSTGVEVVQDPKSRGRELPARRLPTSWTDFGGKSATRRKRIYLVEEHPSLGEGLTQILNEAKGLTICGTAGEVEHALPGIARAKPDLVLAEINLLGKRSLESIKKLRLASRSAKLLIISTHQEARFADKALRAGGDGYIFKQEVPDEIVRAVHDVLAGHIYISEEVMETPRGKCRCRCFQLENLSDAPSQSFRA
jgi:PleD family two-component response regulator